MVMTCNKKSYVKKILVYWSQYSTEWYQFWKVKEALIYIKINLIDSNMYWFIDRYKQHSKQF